MTNPTPEYRRSHLFTLRVWQEDLGEGRAEWRGQIKYVLTGEMRYFRRCSELRAFMQTCLPAWDMADDEDEG